MKRMTLVLIFSILLFPAVLAAGPEPDSLREIGSRRELFVDRGPLSTPRTGCSRIALTPPS